MFKLDFLTPESVVVLDQELVEITLPAHKGELNILPGHSPLMTTLIPGILSYKLQNGESKKFAISWGYCQVTEKGVSVLAETVTAAHEVVANKVLESLKKVEARLIEQTLDDRDWNQTQLEIDRLRAELDLSARQ